MHGAQIRRERKPELEGALRDLAPVLNRHDHQRRLHRPHVERGIAGNFRRDAVIVSAHPHHRGYDQPDQESADPGTGGEFRHEHHNQRYPRGHSSQTVDDHAVRRAFAPDSAPVRYHSSLREREGEKRPNGKQRNETIGHASEQDQQDGCEKRQNQNAFCVDEPPSPETERVRQKAIVRDRPAKPREIGESRVRRKRENHQNGTDGDVIKPAPAGDGRNQHRKHALVSGAAGIRRGDAVSADQERDAREHDDQQTNDHCQRALRILHRRLTKRADAVAYRFHAGHGRAAVGKDLEQHPRAGCCHHCAGRRRGSHDGHRMAAGQYGLEGAHRDRGEQGADKQVGRHHEKDSRLANAAQIDQRDNHQDAQADPHRVRLKTGSRGYQRAHTGRNPHSHDKNVINHQRRRREQARKLPQILRRDRIGTASARIRRNGLAIGEVDDRQQDDNAQADGNDVGDARRTERDQQRERRFRSVCRGAQRVQAENGNAGRSSNLLGPLVRCGESFAKQDIQDGHGPSDSAKTT